MIIIEGLHRLDALAADLLLDARDVARAVRGPLVESGRAVAENMRDHIPVEATAYVVDDVDVSTSGHNWPPGIVRDSITSDRTASTDPTDGNPYVEAGPEHFVARFLEYGTARMAPRPFVDQSVDASVDALIHDIADVTGRL